ncbi:hypothetical protein Q1695_010413 [Nippostrongylus brasiliensis]|nr:hypothetical protein Q1695_010413 [Nippostrongylus brasiliensis]
MDLRCRAQDIRFSSGVRRHSGSDVVCSGDFLGGFQRKPPRLIPYTDEPDVYLHSHRLPYPLRPIQPDGPRQAL